MSYASDALIDALKQENNRLKAENARLKQELESVGTAAYLYGRTDLADENAKLREQMERLVTLLRVDCDIEASWDGLRHFWSIELTEDGCLMRDRACKAEAENAKLRELATHALRHIIEFECEADNREQFQGKPCEWCVYHGSSDCPKIIAVMYGELGIEVGG